MNASPDSPNKPKKKAWFNVKIEELERRLAESEARNAEGATIAPPSPPIVTVEAEPTASGYDKAADPIGWVADVDEVYLVSTVTYLPGNLIPVPPGTKIGDMPEKLRAYTAKKWGNMPFKIQGRNREETENLEVMLDKHWHHRITRHYARRVFESRWSDLPSACSVLPEDYTGRDFEGNPQGHKRPASGDELVEYTRWLLQRLAGKIWLDYAHHHDHIPLHEPNPYGKGRERFTVDPRTIKTATAEGDLNADWEHRA